MDEYLYHGSKISGLKTLEPQESGHGDKFVYAVSDPIFAAIFINRPGGSLVQAWGMDQEKKIPFLVELKENVLDINYGKQRGSLYKLSKEGFFQGDNMWRQEWVHAGPVEVAQEIVLGDVKEYLLGQAAEGKLLFVKYKDRHTHPAGSDERLIEAGASLVMKYGEQEWERIRKYRPDILKKVEEKLKP